MNSSHDSRCSHRLGSPIRKSPDHGLLASPRGLSQLATSFIAYLRQGIHTHALSSLTIKFTLNTEFSQGPGARRQGPEDPQRDTVHLTRYRPPYIGCTAACLQLCSCPSIFNCQRSSDEVVRGQCPVASFELGTGHSPRITVFWWAWVESNYRPHPYQGCALAN
jgi:hypothetical protein